MAPTPSGGPSRYFHHFTGRQRCRFLERVRARPGGSVVVCVGHFVTTWSGGGACDGNSAPVGWAVIVERQLAAPTLGVVGDWRAFLTETHERVRKWFKSKREEVLAAAGLAADHPGLVGGHREELVRSFVGAFLPRRHSVGRGIVYTPSLARESATSSSGTRRTFLSFPCSSTQPSSWRAWPWSSKSRARIR